MQIFLRLYSKIGLNIRAMLQDCAKKDTTN